MTYTSLPSQTKRNSRLYTVKWGFPSDSAVKNPPTMQEPQETGVWSLVLEDSPGEAHGNSNILTWRIPWTEEPGELYSPWGRKELDTIEATWHAHIHTVKCIFKALLNLNQKVEEIFREKNKW